MRHSVRGAVRSVLLVMLVSASLALPVQVMGQAGGSQILVGGQTVAWNEPWSEAAEFNASGDGFQSLALMWESRAIFITSYSVPITAVQARDNAIAQLFAEAPLQTIDRGAYDGVAYSLDSAPNQDIIFGIFVLAMETPGGTVSTAVFAPIYRFQEALESAQSTITIDGAPAFEGIDSAGLQAQLDAANPSVTPPPAQAPEPTTVPVAPTTAPALTPDDGAGADQGTVASPDAATPGANTGAAELPNSYANTINGATTAWSDDWVLNESDAAGVSLILPGTGTTPRAALSVNAVPPSSVANGNAQEAAAAASGGGQRTIIAAIDGDEGMPDLLVLSQSSSDGRTLLFLNEISYSDCDPTSVILAVFQEDLEGVLDLVSSTVRVNGEPVFDDLQERMPELLG